MVVAVLDSRVPCSQRVSFDPQFFYFLTTNLASSSGNLHKGIKMIDIFDSRFDSISLNFENKIITYI